MHTIILLISAVTCVKGTNIGLPSSYSSLSGHQYHPETSASVGWSDSTNNLYDSSSSSIYGHQQISAYPEHVPIIKNGVPIETPEVQAAKAHFHAEYTKAAILAAEKPDPLDGQYAHEYESAKYLPSVNNEWAEKRIHVPATPIWENANDYSHNDYNNQHLPEDTPEVQAAKAAHFQAYAAALSRAAPQKHYLHKRSTEWSQKYEGPIHIPQITSEGVPAETVEVQKAKLAHYEAINDAAGRAYATGNEDEHVAWNTIEDDQAYGPPKSAGWPSAPSKISYDVHHIGEQKWHGPQHIPVLDHKGVPIDTPEVQHARKQHLAALAAEKLKHKGWEGVQQKW